MKESEEEENAYYEEEKKYDKEDEEVDLFEAAVLANMVMRNVDLDGLVQMGLRSMEHMGAGFRVLVVAGEAEA